MDAETLGHVLSALAGGGAAYAAIKVEVAWLKKSRDELRENVKTLFAVTKATDDRLDEVAMKVGIMDAVKDMTRKR